MTTPEQVIHNPQATQTNRLSVAMIVRDAEYRVSESLESIRGIADEIVVVDTGSTDTTKQVVSLHATRVIDYAWNDDFAAARNACLAQVTGDWVLWLDAGETISAEDAAQIRRFVNENADQSKAYLMMVQLPCDHGSTSGEQIGRLRLVPCRKGLKFQGRVRESMIESLAAANMYVEAIEPCISRPDYDLKLEVKQMKARRDLRIAEMELDAAGQLPRLLLAKGEALSTLGDHAAARSCFQRARQAAAPETTQSLEAYYGELTTYDADPKGRDRQIALCLEALEQFGRDAQLLCAMGSYLQGQGRIDLAARSYQAVWEYGQVNPEIWHLEGIADVALVCWSLTLQLNQRDDEALQLLESAIASGRTQAVGVRRQLIDLYIKKRDRQAALQQVDLLSGDLPHREAIRSSVRGACLAAEENWVSALAYLQTAYNAGCRDTLCFRWLVNTLMAVKELDAAAQVLTEWAAAEPYNAEIIKFSDSLKALCEQVLASSEPQGSSVAASGVMPLVDNQNLRVDNPASAEISGLPGVAPHEVPASHTAANQQVKFQ